MEFGILHSADWRESGNPWHKIFCIDPKLNNQELKTFLHIIAITTAVLVSLLALCNMNLACYSKIWFCHLFCMGVILGFSHWRKNIVWRCSRIECWRRCLGVRRTRWQERSLHNGQLYILNSSPNIVWLMTSRRMVYAVHVARMRDIRSAYRVLGGKETTWNTKARMVQYY